LLASDYTLVMNNLYRVVGWGRVWGSTSATAPYVGFPPDLVEVDYTYGYTTVPDGAMYQNPDITVAKESIDDYSVESARAAGGVQLSPAAKVLAEKYRSGGFA
jgi:hypothetical protein